MKSVREVPEACLRIEVEAQTRELQQHIRNQKWKINQDSRTTHLEPDKPIPTRIIPQTIELEKLSQATKTIPTNLWESEMQLQPMQIQQIL